MSETAQSLGDRGALKEMDALLARCEAMLRTLEWVAGSCELCGNGDHKDHQPDCGVARLLADLEQS